jgi:hypothetical protein
MLFVRHRKRRVEKGLQMIILEKIPIARKEMRTKRFPPRNAKIPPTPKAHLGSR